MKIIIISKVWNSNGIHDKLSDVNCIWSYDIEQIYTSTRVDGTSLAYNPLPRTLLSPHLWAQTHTFVTQL